MFELAIAAGVGAVAGALLMLLYNRNAPNSVDELTSRLDARLDSVEKKIDEARSKLEK